MNALLNKVVWQVARTVRTLSSRQVSLLAGTRPQPFPSPTMPFLGEILISWGSIISIAQRRDTMTPFRLSSVLLRWLQLCTLCRCSPVHVTFIRAAFVVVVNITIYWSGSLMPRVLPADREQRCQRLSLPCSPSRSQAHIAQGTESAARAWRARRTHVNYYPRPPDLCPAPAVACCLPAALSLAAATCFPHWTW